MDARSPAVRRGGARRRPAARPRRVGRSLDRGPQGKAGGRGIVSFEAVDAGTGRVRLTFKPEGGEVRVPQGTTVFDAASWNGIAIDSTCGGHGTCRKCKVKVLDGDVPVDRLDPRAFQPDELRDGWRLACRAIARDDLQIEVPPLQTRPKAALVGVGRHVILRPAVQKRYLELEEPTLEDQTSDLERVLAAIDDLELRVELAAVRRLGAGAALVGLQGDGGDLRRRADRCGAGRHHRAAVRDRLRPGDDDRGGYAARPVDRPAGGRALDAEPPAAVRRRRDLAGLGDDDRPGRAGDAADPRPRDPQPADHRGLRGGVGRPGRGLRDRPLRQRHDDPDRARHRPRAAVAWRRSSSRRGRSRRPPRSTSAFTSTRGRRPP